MALCAFALVAVYLVVNAEGRNQKYFADGNELGAGEVSSEDATGGGVNPLQNVVNGSGSD